MNATVTKTVPELRFPGFEGPWETKRLGELCSTFRSGSGITSEDISVAGQFPVYGGNGLRGFTNTYTHDGFFLLIGRQGALCGNINCVEGKTFISEHAIAVAGGEHTYTAWLAYRLDHHNLNRLSESSAQPGLSVGKLTQLKFHVPALPEQRKIADFLAAVDARLQQLSQKKALLEKYKKGVMQQLFTQVLRFKDDHGKDFPDWEEKTLGEVAEIKTGPFGSTLHQSDYVADGTPIITVEHLSNYGLVHKNLPLVSDDDKKVLPQNL
ncbi:MAG: restriction endonuclease subunit S [Verrucomicrobiae bacterium]